MYPTSDPVYQEMFDAVFAVVREAVTPIAVGQPDGSLAAHGTGTLFAVGEVHYVVTASHVLEQAVGAGRELYAFTLAGTSDRGVMLEPVRLDGTIYRFDDPADVGIVRLADDTVVALRGRRFLRLLDVGLRPSCPGWGWISGFPRELVGSPTPNTFAYNAINIGAALTDREPANVQNFDPSCNFVLDTDRQRMWRPDGAPVELPQSFGGISGCSVWQSWWPGDDDPARWRTRQVRVVGVQTSVYPRLPIIKATTWDAVLLAIYRANPELMPSITLHFPGLVL